MFTFSKKNVEYCLSFFFIYFLIYFLIFHKGLHPSSSLGFFFWGGGPSQWSEVHILHLTAGDQCIPFSGFDLMSLYLLEDFVTRGQWGEISMAGQLFSSIYIIQRRWVKSFVFVWFFDVSIHGVWEKDQSSGSKQKRGKSIPFY